MKEIFKDFKKTTCYTCKKIIYVFMDANLKHECENCYTTKLFLMEKDKKIGLK